MKKFASERSVNNVARPQKVSGLAEPSEMKVHKKRWQFQVGNRWVAMRHYSSSSPCLSSTAPPPPKRAPSTTLTPRSKSMTAELEELGKTHTNTHTFADICTTKHT